MKIWEFIPSQQDLLKWQNVHGPLSNLPAVAVSDIGLLIIWPALYLVGYFISVTLEISQRNKDYDAELAARLKAMEEDI